MKILHFATRSAIAVAFALFMSSASCELFDKIDDVTFSISLEETFAINEETVSDGPIAYSHTFVLDAADVNSDFAAHKDKIKSITVKSIKYTVANYNADGKVTFTNGKLSFSAPSASTGSAATLSTLAFQDIQASVGNEYTLSINQAGLDEVAASLKDNKKINVYTQGTFSKAPVAFDLKVVIECDLVANAL